MVQVALNILLTSIVLSAVLWISKTNPILGGFVVSLPLSTLIVLAFSKFQNQDPGDTVMLAKSIFAAVPLTLLFFVPFLLAEKFKLSFWTCYGVGFSLLAVSYGAHKIIMEAWMKS